MNWKRKVPTRRTAHCCYGVVLIYRPVSIRHFTVVATRHYTWLRFFILEHTINYTVEGCYDNDKPRAKTIKQKNGGPDKNEFTTSQYTFIPSSLHEQIWNNCRDCVTPLHFKVLSSHFKYLIFNDNLYCRLHIS